MKWIPLIIFVAGGFAYGQEPYAATQLQAYWLAPGGMNEAGSHDFGNLKLYATGTALAPLGSTGVMKAIGFDGANKSLKISSPGSLGIVNQLTISAWVWIFADSAGDQEILVKRSSAGGTSFQLLYGGQTAGRVGKIANYDGTQIFASASTVSIKTWYHVAFVVIGNVGRIYINGKLDNTGTAQVGAGSGQDVYIGRFDPSFGGSDFYWNGYISNIRVSNVARSGIDIMDEYQAERGLYK